jgi:hypothetical protein
MMQVITDFQYTLRKIPKKIDPDGHKKISKITHIFWGIHFSITITLLCLIVLYDGKIDDLGGTGLVVLQLMVTKFFEASNKLYDNAVSIQNSTADITEVILALIKQYYDVFEKTEIKDPEYERCTESIAILDHQLRDDLDRYSRGMRAWKIVMNILIWTSPQHTPLLQKDVIKDKFLRIIEKLTIAHKKRDDTHVHDTSPETQSLRVMAF